MLCGGKSSLVYVKGTQGPISSTIADPLFRALSFKVHNLLLTISTIQWTMAVNFMEHPPIGQIVLIFIQC